MRFKNQELLTSAILYLFPWTGSLFGGWYLVEGILPSHRYEILSLAVRPTAFPERSLFCPAAVPFPDLLHHSRQSLLVCPSGPVRQPPDRVPKGLTPPF